MSGSGQIARRQALTDDLDMTRAKSENAPTPPRKAADSAAPFLKWAGGKQWLAARLCEALAVEGRYFEPFLGGGALFFELSPNKSVLSDLNAELIETYRAVRDRPDLVIRYLSRYEYSRDCFYRARSRRPRSAAARAARFIYLNRTCWNGLYRVNRKGEFNVPFGTFAQEPHYRNPERLKAASARLVGTELLVSDFEGAVSGAEDADLVYFDPPYTTAHNNNGFIRYNERLFSWDDQKRLARLAESLRLRGCTVVISNADHPRIRSLYPTFRILTVYRTSAIAAHTRHRKYVSEILITSPGIENLECATS